MSDIKVANGFKVQTVVLYANYAQVNGVFVRDDSALTGVNNSLSFSVSLDEGKSLTPETVYDFSLSPRPTTPDTDPDTLEPEADITLRDG